MLIVFVSMIWTPRIFLQGYFDTEVVGFFPWIRWSKLCSLVKKVLIVKGTLCVAKGFLLEILAISIPLCYQEIFLHEPLHKISRSLLKWQWALAVVPSGYITHNSELHNVLSNIIFSCPHTPFYKILYY